MTEPILDLAHLAHLEFLTPKPEESLRFFVDVLGMTATAAKGDSVYLRGWDDYEHADPMKVFFIVTGPLIWLDEEGEDVGHFDVHDYIALCRAHYEKVGLGADAVTALFR